MKGGFFIYDGRFCKTGEAIFTYEELIGRPAGITVSFRAEHNEILFRHAVAGYLFRAAQTWGIDLSGWIDADGKALQRDVSRLLNKNKYYLAAKISLLAYPFEEKIHMLLGCEETQRGYYPLTEPGLLVDFLEGHHKEITRGFAEISAETFIQSTARRRALEAGKPNLIILNSEGMPCESIGGSFGCITGDKVFFPSRATGGFECLLHDPVARSAAEAGFTPVDRDDLTCEELLNAEEVFLYDAVQGIRMILGLEDRRYFSTKTKLIAAKLSFLAQLDRKDQD